MSDLFVFLYMVSLAEAPTGHPASGRPVSGTIEHLVRDFKAPHGACSIPSSAWAGGRTMLTRHCSRCESILYIFCFLVLFVLTIKTGTRVLTCSFDNSGQEKIDYKRILPDIQSLSLNFLSRIMLWSSLISYPPCFVRLYLSLRVLIMLL